MIPATIEVDEVGLSESNKLPMDIHVEFLEGPTDEVDRGQEDSSTEDQYP